MSDEKALASPIGSACVEAVVERLDLEYGRHETIDWRTGQVEQIRFTGVNTCSISARDGLSGRLIENLPAPLEVRPGELIRVTVERISSR